MHSNKILLESFKVVSLFSYQCSLFCLSDSSLSISLSNCSVKNFFRFLFGIVSVALSGDLYILLRLALFVKNFFISFKQNLAIPACIRSRRRPERRRRDLNPRAAVNDLHPFQGCPFGQLGYFSRSPITDRFSIACNYQESRPSASI